MISDDAPPARPPGSPSPARTALRSALGDAAPLKSSPSKDRFQLRAKSASPGALMDRDVHAVAAASMSRTHSLTMREPSVATLTDQQARAVSVDALVNEFLQFSQDPGASLEARAYLVGSTLPTVVLGLERLLKEVERKRILEPPADPASAAAAATGPPGTPGDAPPPPASASRPPPSRAGTSRVVQQDHLPVPFDPLVWLAQFMFRHNPKYSALGQSSAYARNLQNISGSLSNRFAKLQELRIGQLKAERAARDRDREHRRLIKQLANEEKKKTTKELTSAVFRRLMALGRKDEPINLKYLLSVLQKVGQSPAVSINASLTASMAELSQSLMDLSQREESAAPAAGGDGAADQDPAALIERVSDLLSKWTPADFEAFLTEITLWMDGEARAEEDRQVADLIQVLRAKGLTSFDQLFPADPAAAAASGFAGLFGGAGGEGGDDELFKEMRGMNLTKASDESLGAMLKKVAGRTVMSIGDLVTMLQKSANNDAKDLIAAAPAGTEDAEKEEEEVIDMSLVRKQKIKGLFDQLDPEATGAILARELNSLFTASARAIDRADLANTVVQLKFAIPVLNLATHVVRGDYFVDYVFRKISHLNDADFGLVLRTLSDQHRARTASSAPEASATRGPKESEAKLLADIEKVATTVFFDYQVLCSKLVRPAMELLKMTHGHFRLNVALFDRAFTVMASSDAILVGDTLQGDVFGAVAQAGEEVSCVALEAVDGALDELSEAARARAEQDLKAQRDPHHGLNASGNSAGGDGSDGSDGPAATTTTAMPMVNEFHVGHAVVVPVKTAVGEVLGCIHVDALQSMALTKSLATTRDVDMFTDRDIDILRRMAESLAKAVAVLERINKTVTIAESSASFIREQASASTRFYVVEGAEMYFANEEANSVEKTLSEEQLERMNQHPCRFMRPLRHQLMRVERTSDTDFIFSAAESRSTSIRGQATAVPVQDNGLVVAVMVVTSLAQAGGAMQEEDMEEVNKVAEVLGNALGNVRKQKPRKAELEAEQLDDEGELIFAKFMLDTIRDSISKLDSSAIAELKSYKQPPLTIHKVLKCLCYLFGKTPKQVKKWSDTLKFINMDLLRQMVAYDPTAVQKKGKFVRIRRVLNTIPHGDVKKRGSLPAQTVYAWLIVSLDLRNKAVQARRRAQLASSNEDDGEDDEAGDDEDGDD
ncbi:hypothetical protein H9P43_005559 [Blastocladiella emersonii ATCC 22665]|nr:hypothetical protein H9P43_005559 [Blastocladiella emersonii ATCC 22665]